MTIEQFLSGKLRRFSMLDIGLVKAVYFILGLLIYSQYPPLAETAWWFWGSMGVVSMVPLSIHYFSLEGSLLDKGRAYLETNTPAFQVLLFLTQVLFAFMLCSLIPGLASATWWLYVVLMLVLAIKPMTKTVFW